jgi:hypothetical protein
MLVAGSVVTEGHPFGLPLTARGNKHNCTTSRDKNTTAKNLFITPSRYYSSLLCIEYL